jgi:hypothetical protein
MIIDRYFLLSLLYIVISIAAFTGLVWITKFIFKAKPYNIDGHTVVDDVELNQDNLTMSKVTIVIVWLKLILAFLFISSNISNQFFKKIEV